MKHPAKRAFLKSKDTKTISHKSFWICLSLIFVASLIIILSSPNVLTGYAAVQTIAYASQGSTLHFEVRNVAGVKNVTVKFAETVKDGTIFFTEDPTIPFDGISLSKFTVSSTDAAKIGEIRLHLKVQKADLAAAGLKVGDISLYVNDHKVLTVVNEKETAISHSAGDYAYYNAVASELGQFVVGKAYGRVAGPEASPTTVVGETIKAPEQPLTPPALVQETAAPPVMEKPAPVEGESVWMKIRDYFARLFS